RLLRGPAAGVARRAGGPRARAPVPPRVARVGATSAAMEVAAALTEDFAAWRLLRSDSRVKVYAALGVVGARLAAVAPGAATVDARVYLTRPRALRLAQGRFHVVVLLNDAAYALVAA
ncbi:hypothetical protein EG861_14650, partial [Enterococcus faecalis]